ncbi:AAA family ATPase [Dactylosporangium sp. McL0621]|uniref:AAA family ATPase n=1 Tax=Dactylosporangium sp. McL0621 TaxID=3415678 RepID=UPI003CF46E8C
MADAGVSGDDGVPSGLVLLVGPPASGKSSFVRTWVEDGRLDAAGVVSCDAIRYELFGPGVDVRDDPAVFDEMDRRITKRLKAAHTVVVDATNVMPRARTRMIAWAQRYGQPVTALRFRVAAEVLIRRNAQRLGHARVPADVVLRSTEAAARHTGRAQLIGEGVTLVVDVPGEAEGVSPAQAAATIRLNAQRR